MPMMETTVRTRLALSERSVKRVKTLPRGATAGCERAVLLALEVLGHGYLALVSEAMRPSSSAITRSAERAISSSCVITTSVCLSSRFDLRRSAMILRGVLGVEVARGLVRQHDGRRVHEGAPDGHALLLAAGELVGQVVLAAGQAEPAQQCREAALVHLAAVHEHGQAHVLDNVEHRHEVVELVDQPDLAAAEDGELLVGALEDVLAVQVDGARRGPVHAADHVQQRRLARARAADDGHELARRHAEAHVVERAHGGVAGAVGLGEMVDAQNVHAASLVLSTILWWGRHPARA